MTVRKVAIFCLLGVGLLAVGYAFGPASPGSTKKYIFINETEDHRFDESIRGSILAAQKRSSVQNAVLISNALPEDLSDFAAGEFKRLQVGRDFNGRGILYVFAPARRQLKIEVSYALEGVLPDVRVSAYEQAAKTFIFSNRYQDFWAELMITLNMIAQGERSDAHSAPTYLSGGAGILSRTYQPSPEQLRSEQAARSKSGSTVTYETAPEAIDAYLESLVSTDSALGDSVLSAESLVAREITPLTTAHLRRNYEMYRAAGKPRIVETEGFAFALYPPEAHVLPIVLDRKSGWKVHEPIAWALFQRFEDSNRVFLKFPLQDPVFTQHLGAPLYPMREKLKINSLLTHPYLAPYFSFYALETTEARLLTKAPEQMSELELWALADLRMNLGHFTDFVHTYRRLAAFRADSAPVQRNLKFYEETYIFKDADWKLSRP